jgi:hypothetical protein
LGVIHCTNEITLICEERLAPLDALVENGWRLLEVVGPLDFNLVGILAGITSALAKANVSVFVLSTYSTDYIMVKENRLTDTIHVLRAEGFVVDEIVYE